MGELWELVEEWENRAEISDRCADVEGGTMAVTYSVEAATIRQAARELRRKLFE